MQDKRDSTKFRAPCGADIPLVDATPGAGQTLEWVLQAGCATAAVQPGMPLADLVAHCGDEGCGQDYTGPFGQGTSAPLQEPAPAVPAAAQVATPEPQPVQAPAVGLPALVALRAAPLPGAKAQEPAVPVEAPQVAPASQPAPEVAAAPTPTVAPAQAQGPAPAAGMPPVARLPMAAPLPGAAAAQPQEPPARVAPPPIVVPIEVLQTAESIGPAEVALEAPPAGPPQVTLQPAPVQVVEAGSPRPQAQAQAQLQPQVQPAAAPLYLPSAAAAAAAEGDERLVDVDAALAGVEGLVGGPSEGGFSWHTLEVCMKCWRMAYYTFVMGLRPKMYPESLQFGTLYHACWELWYRFAGGRPLDEACDAVRNAGAPKLAGAVHRLFYTELLQFSGIERDTWDIRDVEANGIFWADPIKIAGKKVALPICCRHDLLIAVKDPGAPCAPYGPVASGTTIVDRKSLGSLDNATTKGYGTDGQFLTNALVYERSDEVERHGPLRTMIFAVAAKHKNPGPQSFFRVEVVVDQEILEEFYQTGILPAAAQLYERLATPAVRDDISRWPKNRSQCVGRYGLCRFYDLCDTGGLFLVDELFNQDPERALTVDKLWTPPAEVRRKAKAAQDAKRTADEAAAPPEGEGETDGEGEGKTKKKRGRKPVKSAEERKELKERASAAFNAALRESLLALPQFSRATLVTAAAKRAQVQKELQNRLTDGTWEEGTEFPFEALVPSANGGAAELTRFAVTVKPGCKGVAWVAQLEGCSVRGALAWSTMAREACDSWWDPAAYAPEEVKQAPAPEPMPPAAPAEPPSPPPVA